MNLLSFLILLVLAASGFEAHACFTASPEQKADWKALVKRTNDIALVEITEVTPVNKAVAIDPNGDTVYKLKLVEAIKGKADANFDMVGGAPDKGQDTDFSRHRSKSFWSRGTAGRSPIRPDCVIPPTFKKGQRYLVFLTKPYHFKSFELIKVDSDEWLRKVRNEIKMGK